MVSNIALFSVHSISAQLASQTVKSSERLKR